MPRKSVEDEVPLIDSTGLFQYSYFSLCCCIKKPVEIDREFAVRAFNASTNDIELLFYTGCIEIGGGSFGKVFKIQNMSTNKDMAVKVVRDDSLGQKELEVLRMVDHPNIIKLHYYIFTKDLWKKSIHLVMEYLPDNFSNLISSYAVRNHHLEPIYVRIYSFQLVQCLSYMRFKRLCHRDIKPENILVQHNLGILKLCDFGVSKIMVDAGRSKTRVGTQSYRAPEMLYGSMTYGIAVDIWSFGCVLGEMLTNRPIFKSRNVKSQFKAIADLIGPPSASDFEAMGVSQMNAPLTIIFPKEPGERLGKDIDIEAEDLLFKCLIYNPQERILPLEASGHELFKNLFDSTETLPNLTPLPKLFLTKGRTSYLINTVSETE